MWGGIGGSGFDSTVADLCRFVVFVVMECVGDVSVYDVVVVGVFQNGVCHHGEGEGCCLVCAHCF